MKDLEIEKELDLEINSNVHYEVWILGVNEDYSVNDFDYELGTFDNSVSAVEFTDKCFKTFDELLSEKEDLKYKLLAMRPAKITIRVEEIVVLDLDSGESDINTLFEREIDLEELYKLYKED